MRAVILAAGRGSRLKRFTDDRPKCLNRVGGRYLIEYQLAALRGGGVTDPIVITGYRSEMLRAFSARTIHNERWECTNMVASLLCAKNEFGGSLLVSYSDILYGHGIVASLAARKEDAVVAFDPQWRDLWEMRFSDPLADAESFRTDAGGRITDIGRRVSSLYEIAGQYMGLMKFSPVALSWIEDEGRRSDLDRVDMTTLLRRLIEQGRPIHSEPVVGGWMEVDTGEDLVLAERLLSEGRLNLG